MDENNGDNDRDEIDPNEWGELLQDTCNKTPRKDHVQEVQEN